MQFNILMAVALAAMAALPSTATAQEPDLAETYSGLALRDIGPAMASGRISDLAMHPDGWHVFYAATASGGRIRNACRQVPIQSNGAAGTMCWHICFWKWMGAATPSAQSRAQTCQSVDCAAITSRRIG